eukprot:5261112-Amphidinium_carterae.1
MSSAAATGYSTPEPEESPLVCAPEPPEAEGMWEGGRTVSGNIQCDVCCEYGLWSQFAFAELDKQELTWTAALVQSKKLNEAVAVVKREQGGRIQEPQEEQFNDGNVVLACYRCWIKATGET